MSMILRRQYDPETIAKLEAERLEPPFSLEGIEGLTLKETKMVMHRAIALLTEKERTVLTLCYFEGLERSEEHTSELQSHSDLVCRLLLEKKKKLGGAGAIAPEEANLLPIDVGEPLVECVRLLGAERCDVGRIGLGRNARQRKGGELEGH